MSEVYVQLRDGSQHRYKDASVYEPEDKDVVKVYGKADGDKSIELKAILCIDNIDELIVS